MANSFYSCILYALSVASAVQAHALPEADTVLMNDLFVRDVAEAEAQAVPRPALGSVPYGSIITNCVIPGTVALTFDDGPGPYTAQLLDLLAANGLKATFFVLGKSVAGYEAVVQRAYSEGHQIGSHTFTHTSLETLSTSGRQQEMTRNEALFIKLLGNFPTYMRPPYGSCYAASGCLRDMGNLGYHVVDWNVDTKDYENDSPSKIQVAKNNWDAAFSRSSASTSSFIPLTHDVHYNTVKTLAPYMIAGIKQKGFRAVTVGECLGDPEQNWYRDPKTGSNIVYRHVAPQQAANSTSSVSVSVSASATSSILATSASSSSRPATVSGTMTSAAASSSASSAVSSASSAAATRTNGASSIHLTLDTVLFGLLAMLYMSVMA